MRVTDGPLASAQFCQPLSPDTSTTLQVVLRHDALSTVGQSQRAKLLRSDRVWLSNEPGRVAVQRLILETVYSQAATGGACSRLKWFSRVCNFASSVVSLARKRECENVDVARIGIDRKFSSSYLSTHHASFGLHSTFLSSSYLREFRSTFHWDHLTSLSISPSKRLYLLRRFQSLTQNLSSFKNKFLVQSLSSFNNQLRLLSLSSNTFPIQFLSHIPLCIKSQFLTRLPFLIQSLFHTPSPAPFQLQHPQPLPNISTSSSSKYKTLNSAIAHRISRTLTIELSTGDFLTAEFLTTATGHRVRKTSAITILSTTLFKSLTFTIIRPAKRPTSLTGSDLHSVI